MNPLATEVLPALRRYLGVSIAELASHLGVLREAIWYAERGMRPLPPGAWPPLVALLTALPPEVRAALAVGEVPPSPPPSPAAGPDPAALRRHQQQCQRTADRLRAELADLQAAEAQSHARLTLLAGLPEPPPVAPGADPAWLTRLEREARAQLAKGDATTQTLLAIRISALTHEAAEAERLATAAETGPPA